jgi:HK97 family phage prohead protease
MNEIKRQVQIRKVTEELLENRQLEFVISSEAVDSYGTVFRLDGWDLENYNRNPVVSYGHNLFSQDPDVAIIGRSEVFREGSELIGRVTLEEGNKVADKILRKVKNGMLRMASVGAHIMEAAFGNKEMGEDPDVIYFNRSILVEWSIVPVGANPDAHMRSSKDVEQIRKDLEAQLQAAAPAEDNENRSVFEAQCIINQK